MRSDAVVRGWKVLVLSRALDAFAGVEPTAVAPAFVGLTSNADDGLTQAPYLPVQTP